MKRKLEARQEDSQQKLARFRAWKKGTNSFGPPQQITIPPTGRCNLRCSYCVHSMKSFRDANYHNDAEDDTMLRMIRGGLELGVRQFNLVGGGEPFIRADLTLRMMRAIKEGGAIGGITTNGTLLDDDAIEAILDMGWDSIMFSLDSHRQESADGLRGEGTYAAVVERIKKINSLKQEKGTDLPVLGFNVVITRKNYMEIPDILKFASDLGVWNVEFIPVTIHSPEMEDLRLSSEDITKFGNIVRESLLLLGELSVFCTNLQGLQDTRIVSETGRMVDVIRTPQNEREGEKKYLAKEVSTRGRFGNLLKKLQPLLGSGMNNVQEQLPYCFAPWSNLVIHHDGSLNPCQHNNKASQIRTRRLEDAWYADDYLNRMRAAHQSHKLPGFCQKCCSAVVLDNHVAFVRATSSGGAS